MIILDTNVLSEVMQKQPSKTVIAWLDRQATNSIWTTAVTVFEIEFGLRRLAAGKRRKALDEAFQALLSKDLGGRILAFDAQAALQAAEISASLESSGQRVGIRDVQIAGIARAHQAPVATRNTRDFEHSCAVIDPWNDLSH